MVVILCARCLVTLGTKIPSTEVLVPVGFTAVTSSVLSGAVVPTPTCALLAKEESRNKDESKNNFIMVIV